MNRLYAASMAAALLATIAATSQALAAPPTVVPSPGYDARLQEQRRATTFAVDPPVVTPGQPAPKRHTKRIKSH